MRSQPCYIPVRTNARLALAPTPQPKTLNLPILHSRPHARQKLFIALGGWYGIWEGRGIYQKPFSLDGQPFPGKYSLEEVQWITEIHRQVTELVEIYNWDITTEQPDNLSQGWTVTVAVGGHWQDWLGTPSGGVAWQHSFFVGNPKPNVSYVFPENLIIGFNDKEAIARCIVHEALHQLGLSHQCEWRYVNGVWTKISEYRSGDGNRGPVMGLAYDDKVGYLAIGQNTDNQLQDDALMVGKVIGYAPKPVRPYGLINSLSDGNVIPFSAMGPTTLTFKGLGATHPLIPIMKIHSDKQSLDIWNGSNSIQDIIRTVPLARGQYWAEVKSDGTQGSLGKYELYIERTITPQGVALDVDIITPTTAKVKVYHDQGYEPNLTVECGTPWEIAQRLYKFKPTTDFYENHLGRGEIWLEGTPVNGQRWYFLERNGNLYHWDGGDDGWMVDCLSPISWWRPRLMFNAPEPLFIALHLKLGQETYLNSFGGGERWYQGDPTEYHPGWYFILPNGEFWVWDGTPQTLSGKLLCRLPPTWPDSFPFVSARLEPTSVKDEWNLSWTPGEYEILIIARDGDFEENFHFSANQSLGD